MKHENKKDLRIARTQQLIHGAFGGLLLEKPFEEITVTELSRRANINKKTFYRHYTSLGELLEEVQHGYARPFADLTAGLRYPDDTDVITREFLLYSSKQGELYDAMASKGFHERLFAEIMDEMGAERINCSKPPDGWSPDEWALYVSLVVDSQINVYRRWILSGRAIPVNRMVTMGVRLVCSGACLERYRSDNLVSRLPMAR